MKKGKRIHIITGHYGSGKTEFAVNYAMKRAEIRKNIVVGDLDIVNPYFRSREKQREFENIGIRIVSSSTGYSSADVPAISPEIYGILQNEQFEVILDVGGDPAGTRVLGRYHEYFKSDHYDMWMVINANRPNTQDVQSVLEYIRGIENAGRTGMTGLINNTHMLRETTVQDLIRGKELIEKVSETTGLPIIYTSAIRAVAEGLPATMGGEIFPLDLQMRPDWL